MHLPKKIARLGVMQSPVTPLKEDFSPDYETFERLVDFHVRALNSW